MSVYISSSIFIISLIIITWYHSKEALRELNLESLSQYVFEFHALLHESRFDVTPRQVVVIEQVDHDVHGRFHVVSARLVVAAT